MARGLFGEEVVGEGVRDCEESVCADAEADVGAASLEGLDDLGAVLGAAGGEGGEDCAGLGGRVCHRFGAVREEVLIPHGDVL